MKYYGGYQEVANYQIRKVKDNLESIFKHLNKDNYLRVKKELDDVLNLYQNILNNALESREIKDLITRINYELYKLELEDLIYNEEIDVSSFLPFVLQDIQFILNDREVSEYIKEQLEKYYLDRNLIIDHFNKIILLINLSKRKQLSKEDITKEVNQTLYKESDIKKIHHRFPKEVLDAFHNYEVCGSYKKTIEEFCKANQEIYNRYPKECDAKCITIINAYFPSDKLIEELVKDDVDFRLIAEALIVNANMNALLNLRKKLKENGKDLDYVIDCAVIVHKEEIESSALIQYIISSNNEYLIRYVLKSKKEAYFNDQFLKYAMKTNNQEILGYIRNCDNLNILCIFWNIKKDNQVLENIKKRLQVLTPTRRLQVINEHHMAKEMIDFIIQDVKNGHLNRNELLNLKNLNVENDQLVSEAYLNRKDLEEKDKLTFLISKYIQTEDCEQQDYYLKQIYDFHNKDYIWILIDHVKNKHSVDKIVINIPDEDIRKEFENVYYDAIKNKDFLKYKDVVSLRFTSVSKISKINKVDINDFNPFEASFASSYIKDEDCAFMLVRKFYQCHLNWEYLIKQFGNKLSYSKQEEELFYYFYLGDREAFLTFKYVPHSVFFKILSEHPNGINDVLTYLQPDEIVKLPKETLDIFCEFYEEKLKKENISFEDKKFQMFNQNTKKEIIEFFTFVMHRGFISNDLLINENIAKYGLYPILLNAILNTNKPYLRPSFLKCLGMNDTNCNYVFLSSSELQAIDDNNQDSEEIKEMKKRQYYGGLLHLMKSAPEQTKKRIVLEIIYSRIKEFIYYLKEYYPEFLHEALSGLSDIYLYQEVMSILNMEPTNNNSILIK